MNGLQSKSNNVTSSPVRPAEALAQAGTQPNNDLITLIRALRLMWKHKGWIALTSGTIR